MATDPYELDADIASLNRRTASSKIPTKKSSMYGANPQLQPDAEYDYESDPDIAILTNRKPKTEEHKANLEEGLSNIAVTTDSTPAPKSSKKSSSKNADNS